MNKTLYIKLASLLLIGSLVSGCGDFLEPQAKSEFVPKDAQALNELLLGEAYPLKGGLYIDGFLGMLDDDVDGAPFQEPAHGQNSDYLAAPFSWQGDVWLQIETYRGSYTNNYKSHYKHILGCNAIFDYINQVTDTPDNIAYVLAQAHALRGFLYLHLVNLFGQPYQLGKDALGVPLKRSSQIEDAPLSRSTVGEVYEFIEADLLEAERLYNELPEDRQWSMSFRTSLPMVQLLLSRTYLYTENWDKAAEYAEKVLSNPNFSYVDLRSIKSTNDEGKRVYTDFMNYANSPEIIWPYGNIADATMWLSDYSYSSYDGRYIHSYFRASDDFYNSFDDTDLRKKLYIVDSKFVMPDTGEPMHQAIGKVFVNSDYYAPKESDTYYGHALRLSEATLNYAEAKAMTPGGESEALRVINEMRMYRFQRENYREVTVADCPNGVLEFVKEERRRELCFEGFRWFDLRRWGMPQITHTWYTSENTKIVYTLEENDPLYTMPLPITTLEKNPELVQIPLGTVPRQGEVITINY